MKYFAIGFIFILSSCITVDWDGFISSKEYRFTFKLSDGNYAKGVVCKCEGNEIWPSIQIAKEINEIATPTESDGVSTLRHSGYHIGGTYQQFGSYTFGKAESWEVTCNFTYNGKTIASQSLSTYKDYKIIFIE